MVAENGGIGVGLRSAAGAKDLNFSKDRKILFQVAHRTPLEL